MNIAKELLRLVNDEEGLTVVEYAIAGGLVAATVALAFSGLGTAVEDRIVELTSYVDGTGVSGAGGTTP
jgi:pilus assembly protein Flp/PilA